MKKIRILRKVQIETRNHANSSDFCHYKGPQNILVAYHTPLPTSHYVSHFQIISMVLKIYGDWVACVQRIACVLNEKGVPYETIPVSMANGEHKSPQYLEKQPFGQVPYIVSYSTNSIIDGTSKGNAQFRMMMVLFSTKVALYVITSPQNILIKALPSSQPSSRQTLSSTKPHRLRPFISTVLSTPQSASGCINREMHRYLFIISSYISTLFSRFHGLETNEAVYDKAIADLSKQLDVYDKILAKQRYLAGDVSSRIH